MPDGADRGDLAATPPAPRRRVVTKAPDAPELPDGRGAAVPGRTPDPRRAGDQPRADAGRHDRDRPPDPRRAEGGPVELGAPAARPRFRHGVALAALVLLVILPTGWAAHYLTVLASDRYGSATAFSVRSNQVTAPLEILGTVTQLGNSSAVLDGQILYDFIRSQQIVEQVRGRLPLEEYWNREPRDWLFALGTNQPIEEITRYWNRAVDVSLDPASGILTVEARAFRPDEAQAIATAILDASAELVNRIADTARADAVRNARVELAEAEARLRDIRTRLRRFRDLEQEVDPAQNARVAIELVAGLEEELSEAQTRLSLLTASLSDSSPRIQLLRRRIRTLKARIEAERTRLGSGVAEGRSDARPLAAVVGDYEELVVDREFAEQAYTLALATYEQAVAEARRRHRYLAAHVRPTLSEQAAYPDRPLLLAAVLGLSLAVWAALMLVGWNVRDRR